MEKTFSVGDIMENKITKEPCMIIKFIQSRQVKLLSWNMLDIWQEDIFYLNDNFIRIGHADLSLLAGSSE